MTEPDGSEAARTALARLAAERREDFAGLSRVIGRNPAYIQQYVRRGTPRRLAEEDRRRLAAYLGVDEALLGGPPSASAARTDGLVAIARYDLGASAGAGALDAGEFRTDDLLFPAALLRALGAGPANGLSLVRVAGDSMLPALGDGDDILVDRGDGAARLRDGIYVLRHDGTLLVKRVRPARGGVAVSSDNRAYPGLGVVAPGAIDVIGRVLWAGGRVR